MLNTSKFFSDNPEEIFEKLNGRKILFEVKYDGAHLEIYLKGQGVSGLNLRLT